jgi:hypothetical protein
MLGDDASLILDIIGAISFIGLLIMLYREIQSKRLRKPTT